MNGIRGHVYIERYQTSVEHVINKYNVNIAMRVCEVQLFNVHYALNEEETVSPSCGA